MGSRLKYSDPESRTNPSHENGKGLKKLSRLKCRWVRLVSDIRSNPIRALINLAKVAVIWVIYRITGYPILLPITGILYDRYGYFGGLMLFISGALMLSILAVGITIQLGRLYDRVLAGNDPTISRVVKREMNTRATKKRLIADLSTGTWMGPFLTQAIYHWTGTRGRRMLTMSIVTSFSYSLVWYTAYSRLGDFILSKIV